MSDELECPHCSGRKKYRNEEEQKKLIRRLCLAEGQIRGIRKMVEENAYCPDIMIQVSAVTNALVSFNKELLAAHIRSCVTDDIRSGNQESIDEFVKLMQKLMK
ncbi:MAG: metal-sensing transcriptional repressor [Anaerolineaceae bacterium]|nr:metal-sensing transcriptional repressor [Anaerolineaceae bacterium]